MGFVVKVAGADSFELSKEVVQTADFEVNIPKDSNARAKDMAGTIVLTGRILTGLEGALVDQTVKAAQWSLVPAEKAEAYRSVTIDVIAAGQTVRQYVLPTAFCVGYKEDYDDQTGVGTFELIIRQKKDKLSELQINGGYAAQ